jgi:hypothetical protein
LFARLCQYKFKKPYSDLLQVIENGFSPEKNRSKVNESIKEAFFDEGSYKNGTKSTTLKTLLHQNDKYRFVSLIFESR